MDAGEIVGNYTLVKRLGAGGMAVVWEAEHRTMGTRHALKFLAEQLTESPDALRRLADEARIAFDLGRRANIVRATDHFYFGNRPVIVMDLLDGETLQQVLDRDTSPWTWMAAWRQVRPVVAAMSVAHASSVVHRDLKPSYIVLHRDPARPGKVTPMVIDLGIARDFERKSLTATGAELGTYVYMPPEQFEDPRLATATADVYALAMILWRLVSGRMPVDTSRPKEVLEFYKGHGPLPMPEAVPEGVAIVLAAALSFDPAKRPSDAGVLLAALDQADAEAIPRRLAPTDAPSYVVDTLTAPQHVIPAGGETESRKIAKSHLFTTLLVALLLLTLATGSVVVYAVVQGRKLAAMEASSRESALPATAAPPAVAAATSTAAPPKPASSAADPVWTAMLTALPHASELPVLAAWAGGSDVDALFAIQPAALAPLISESSDSDVRPWFTVATMRLPGAPALRIETTKGRPARIGASFLDSAEGCADKIKMLGAPVSQKNLACGGKQLLYRLAGHDMVVYQPGIDKPICEWWIYAVGAFEPEAEAVVHDGYSCNDAAGEALARRDWPTAARLFERAVARVPRYGRAWLRYCKAAQTNGDYVTLQRACASAAMSNFESVRKAAKAVLAAAAGGLP
ncbi:MAG: serine/threonine protein kinase [Deltaproteobacteria bacterium]|nr:serine/threonine protein kinase [Deltaproteobacteria bacterium]